MKWWSSLILMVLLYQGCLSEKEDKALNGDLFFGLSLGQTREEFYEDCWRLNKEESVTHSENMYVQYTTTFDSISKMVMLFYPEFDKENKMKMMDVQFKYTAWAPWSEYQSSKLMPVVLDTLMKWYPDKPFKYQEDKNIYTKKDGRRYIIASIMNDERVRVQIFDYENKEYKK